MLLRRLAFLLALVVGAGLMLSRDAFWRQGDVTYRGFHVPYENVGGTTVRWTRAYAKLEIPDPARWRPLRIILTLRPPSGAPGTGTPLTVSVDDVPVTRLRVRRETSAYEVVLGDRRTDRSPAVSAGQRLLGLQLRSEILAANDDRGVGVEDVHVRPILTPRATITSLARGAALGALAWLLVVWPVRATTRNARARRRAGADANVRLKPDPTYERERHPADARLGPDPTHEGKPGPMSERTNAGDAADNERWDPDAGTRSAALLEARHEALHRDVQLRRSLLASAAFAMIVFAYLVAWATVKPPMQAPDEFSHVVKALSMPGAPWIPPRDSLPVPDGRWNPLCLMPHELLRLVGNARNFVGDEDLATLRRVRWPGSGQTQGRFTQAWSYPPLFYWVAFAVGQGATSALRLTPYDSMFAWRVGVCLVSAVLWTLVLIVLRRVDGDPGHRSWVAVFLLANPMLAFISSSVNPDALLVPLSVLVFLLSFLQARDGGYAFATFVTVLAACLVKITGVFVVAALFPAVLLMLAFRRTSVRDALVWFRAAAGACLLAWVVFYAWSPPRLYGPPMAGRSIQVTEYLTYLDEHAEERWTSYWGRLGWLDYQADQWFYTALWWAFAVAAVLALARIRRWRIYGGVVGFAFTFGLCFLVLTFAGEFAQVREIGFTFQGRYTLPASIGIASLVLASGWLPRMAMLALVVWLNAALFDTSVHRYWGDWSRFFRAQPFAGMVTR